MAGVLICGCGYTAKVYRREDAPAKCPKCGARQQVEQGPAPTLNRKQRRAMAKHLKLVKRPAPMVITTESGEKIEMPYVQPLEAERLRNGASPDLEPQGAA
jgi:hypothetical protein